MSRIAAPALLVLFALAAPVAGAQGGDAGRTLHDLFDREWQVRLGEFPRLATSVGIHDANDRLSSFSFESLARRDALWRGFLAELDNILLEALS